MDMAAKENTTNFELEDTGFDGVVNPNVTEKCTLNGTISLHYEKCTFAYENHQKKLVSIEKKDFPFSKASEKELMQMRLDGKPLFILYKRGCRFYTEIPDISFGAFSDIAKTECVYGNACCNWLLPMPTEKGGCDKVYDLPLEIYTSKNYTFSELMRFAKRIDKYPFITAGYETCNIHAPVFVVLECKNCTLN